MNSKIVSIGLIVSSIIILTIILFVIRYSVNQIRDSNADTELNNTLQTNFEQAYIDEKNKEISNDPTEQKIRKLDESSGSSFKFKKYK